MANEMRDRLVELIQNAVNGCARHWAEIIADHLIENGVIVPPNNNIGEFSDGYHTFNELYHHRAILFSVICNLMPDKAWKSKLHDTGDMFEGMFIVGIETPNGSATYHYDIEPYWDMFKVKELERAPKWDGHTSADAIQRISMLDTGSVEVKHGEWIVTKIKHCWNDVEYPVEFTCSECGRTVEQQESYCHCGAKMDI